MSVEETNWMQRLCPTRTHKKGGTVTLLPPQRETGGQGRDGGRRRFTMTILCYLDFFAICIYLTFLKPSTGDRSKVTEQLSSTALPVAGSERREHLFVSQEALFSCLFSLMAFLVYSSLLTLFFSFLEFCHLISKLF